MTYTSAEAAKLLRKLNDQYTALLEMEERSRDFLAAVGEDVESVRPKYDYRETQKELAQIEGRIRAVKHGINVFNLSHKVPGFDMTIDEMLVYIPQLTKKKAKLLAMKSVLPKAREASQYGRQSSIIDYRYANYDIDEVTADYDRISDELSKAQTALDVLNNTETFELDI